MQLRKKIKEILVDVYKTKSMNKDLFDKYLKFEEIRNDIIHQKSIDHTDFYEKYFKRDVFDYCRNPEEVILFFFKEREIKDYTNHLWPWIVNEENDFPSRIWDPNYMGIDGEIYVD